jgi:tetratricopeptide (TPR) repeat protein
MPRKGGEAVRRIMLIAMLVLCMVVAAYGQTPEPTELQKQEAKREINEGALAYRERNYYEAQLHFERAMTLNPTQKNAPLFYARAIHSQYKLGDESPENVAKARAAISAYERVLEVDPASDDAPNAIVYLYRMIKDDDAERRWLVRRAEDEKVASEKRSMAYTILVSKDWQCSYNVTDKPENKRAVERRDRVIVTYVMPKDRSEFSRAEQCANRGLELSEKGVTLDPQSEQAWSFKTNILLEQVKLAQMEGSRERAAALQKQADEAQQHTTLLIELNKKKKEVEEKEKAEQSQRPPDETNDRQ